MDNTDSTRRDTRRLENKSYFFIKNLRMSKKSRTFADGNDGDSLRHAIFTRYIIHKTHAIRFE